MVDANGRIELEAKALMECSPKLDPLVMRVSAARKGKETFDEEEARKASHSRADHQESA